MAVFMAKRIIAGRNEYVEVVAARPDLKAGIGEYLIANGYEYLMRH